MYLFYLKEELVYWNMMKVISVIEVFKYFYSLIHYGLYSEVKR